LSGSKAGLAEAQFREAKASYERNKILFQKESFLNQIGINLSLLLKLQRVKSLLIVKSASASVNEARDNLGEL
jgi:HlyD family secretion protein